jgi:hypothetical protein
MQNQSVNVSRLVLSLHHGSSFVHRDGREQSGDAHLSTSVYKRSPPQCLSTTLHAVCSNWGLIIQAGLSCGHDMRRATVQTSCRILFHVRLRMALAKLFLRIIDCGKCCSFNSGSWLTHVDVAWMLPISLMYPPYLQD